MERERARDGLARSVLSQFLESFHLLVTYCVYAPSEELAETIQKVGLWISTDFASNLLHPNLGHNSHSSVRASSPHGRASPGLIQTSRLSDKVTGSCDRDITKGIAAGHLVELFCASAPHVCTNEEDVCTNLPRMSVPRQSSTARVPNSGRQRRSLEAGLTFYGMNSEACEASSNRWGGMQSSQSKMRPLCSPKLHAHIIYSKGQGVLLQWPEQIHTDDSFCSMNLDEPLLYGCSVAL